ncbi:hypothetical protein JXR93_12865 [bacterium]|nr:hypothetical protein [bacterium]
MSCLLKTLEKLFEQKKVISIYHDDNDKFSIGIINSLNNKEISLYTYDKVGDYDGVLSLKIKDITMIGYDSYYERKYESLIELKKSNKLDNNIKYYDENLSIEKILKISKKNQKIVVIKVYDSSIDLIGFVNDIDKTHIELFLLSDNWKEIDGVIIIKISEISNINFDDKRCQVIEYILKN